MSAVGAGWLRTKWYHSYNNVCTSATHCKPGVSVCKIFHATSNFIGRFHTYSVVVVVVAVEAEAEKCIMHITVW